MWKPKHGWLYEIAWFGGSAVTLIAAQALGLKATMWWELLYTIACFFWGVTLVFGLRRYRGGSLDMVTDIVLLILFAFAVTAVAKTYKLSFRSDIGGVVYTIISTLWGVVVGWIRPIHNPTTPTNFDDSDFDDSDL